MKTEKPVLGLLGAVIFVLPPAPLTWLLTRSGVFTGLAGMAGYLMSLAGYRVLGNRCGQFARWISLLLPPLAALPGLYYGYAELIYQENLLFGCTMPEALELVPTVALDPINRGQLLWDLGAIVLLELLTAFLLARYHAQKQ